MTEQDRLNQLLDLKAKAEEELDPELQPYVEQGSFGPMLRHPLVYAVPCINNGIANDALKRKKDLLFEAINEEDWHSVIWLHERPYRLNALIDYVIGRYDDPNLIGHGDPIPLVDVHSPSITNTDLQALAADVWVDSENIEQNIEEWQALFLNGEGGLWLGTDEEKAAFDALPDPIRAFRGGVVGDWSWTTDERIAEFFSRRSGYPVRSALIPKADCFGYLTRRGEAELLVRLTSEREPLVYPNRFSESGEPDA